MERTRVAALNPNLSGLEHLLWAERDLLLQVMGVELERLERVERATATTSGDYYYY